MIKKDSTNYNLIFTLAQKFQVRADTSNALKYFLKATEHEDGSKEAINYYMASVLSMKLGKRVDAIKLCKRAIELEPEYSHYNGPEALQIVATIASVCISRLGTHT